MNREKAIDKIQKLLALGRRSNYQAEAETALVRAQRLMLAYNIEMGEVDQAEIDGGDAYVFETAWNGSRRPVEAKFLQPIVSEFFFVRILVHPSDMGMPATMQFFGDRHNVAVARYAWVFLVRTFRDLWRKYKRGRRLGEGDRQAYYWGLEQGFRARLNRERESAFRDLPASENALTVVGNRLDSALRAEFPELRTKTRRHTIVGKDSSIEDGRRDGENINLRTPIAGEADQPRRLLGSYGYSKCPRSG